MKTLAWNGLPHGARLHLLLLMANHNTNLQNHVFLSTRDAARKLGSNRDYVRRWFRELQHYGFIVMLNPGGPGVEGRGKAPHYRLTECWYAGQKPTRDFEGWDGVLYVDKKWQRKTKVPGPQCGPTVVPKVGPVGDVIDLKKRASGS